VNRMPEPKRVISIPCPGFVDRIEAGKFDRADYEAIFQQHLAPYHGLAVSGIVLGCTHFPFIGHLIRSYALEHFTGSCTLYDGSVGTARQLERVLARRGLMNGSGSGNVTFLTSGDLKTYMPLYEALMKQTLTI